MSEVGLPEGHYAGVEIAPNKEQQKRDRSVVFVANGIEDRRAEIEAEKQFGVGHPAGFVSVGLSDERIVFPFNLELRCARKLGLLTDESFQNSLRVSHGDADTGSHNERHVQEGAPPALRAQF